VLAEQSYGAPGAAHVKVAAALIAVMTPTARDGASQKIHIADRLTRATIRYVLFLF